MTSAPKIVIVGASLAGLRTAEAVRAALPEAEIVLIGEEPYQPYNRPPLSKEALAQLARNGAGADAVFATVLLRSRLAGAGVDIRLGHAVTSVDAKERTVTLQTGEALHFDWLVAATGLRPRRLPMAGSKDRRHVMRRFDDALRLAPALTRGAAMVVVGGGFIGCEIASTATALGLSVTIVGAAPHLMHEALGPRVSQSMAILHRARGVDIVTGRSLAAVEEVGSRVNVVLDDGRALEADLIVEAIGSLPNVEWLTGCGLDLSDGILCGADLRAEGSERILAVGDVARFPNALFDATPRRIEHWCVPGQTARRAARTIAAATTGAPDTAPFAPMPSFWSVQHDIRLQSFGAPSLADSAEVLTGDLGDFDTGPVVVEYHRRGELIGVLGLGAPPHLLVPHQARLTATLTEVGKTAQQAL